MNRRAIFIPALLLAACGPEPQPRQPDTLPTPSGAPLAQQASPQPREARPPVTAVWESAERRGGTALRLTEGDRSSLELACIGRPARMIVRAPGFKVIESEDRFSLGLGDEPVTLAADLRRRNGVTADAAIPENISDLLREAKQVSARYGNQRIGPAPPPSPELARAFGEACRKLAG
jgi:hypothetical protein